MQENSAQYSGSSGYDEPQPESVLFLTRKWPPAVGGMETYSVKLTEELGRQVALATEALPGRADGRPPTVLAMIGFACRVAVKYLTSDRVPAVIHVGDLAAWPLGLLAKIRGPQAAVVISAHGTDVSFHRRGGWKGRLYGAYLRLGSRLSRNASLIANSGATANAAAETGWEGAAIVPLATDFVSEGPIPSHDGQLLFAGRLVERKGCQWFVSNVLPLLPPQIGLKVAGPVWDKSEGSVLQNPRVTYLGALGRQDLIEAYRTSLCVVVPNIEPSSGEFEGFGLVATEASSVGGVVLAAANGGLIDAVIDGETGFLLPAGNSETWRSKILEIADWPDGERRTFVAKSMERTRQVYGWQRVANDVLSIYRRSIASLRPMVSI
jgi:glycosyltransferase involved in cell wall biosynthesis